MAKNVLLIEYEQRDRNRVRSLLASPDFEVTEAHDGEEGLAAFAPGRFDVVLLSGKLPRISSSDVIREIRNKGGLEAPPILLMPVGYSGSNTKADAQKIGAFEIVPKPFTDGAIVAAVRSALDATDKEAKTVRIPTGALTSSDIFSDLLEELGREATDAGVRPVPKAPAPPPAAARAGEPDEMERRLRDTLSGVTGSTKPAAAPRPSPPAVPKAPRPRKPGEDDLDRMISETLRIPIPRTKETSPPTPARADATPARSDATPARADQTPTGSRRAEPREAVIPEGPDRFGQYELLSKIASGGMAEVFRARRTGVEGFQKIVAIKKILPHIADNDEFITMFADEAKLAAELNHPNIVHIYDLGKIQAGGYFIAMEYVEGTDLRSILRRGRHAGLPMPVPLAVYVASKVASALDYAHRRRDARGEDLHIVHRDVSPQNILISHEGEIKLCDFGIAKADRKVSQTESGSLKGKLQYMSPEQAWGKPIDHRSDLFSLGSVLHEMLTGERLFRGATDMVVLELVRKAEVVAPSQRNPDVPAALDAVVLKALARDRDARYATGAEMLRDLESILYSYTPAPGSADVAIYLDHLREAEADASLTRRAEPARAPAPPPPVAPAPVAPAPPVVPPAPPVVVPPAPEVPAPVVAAAEVVEERPQSGEVFGSFSAARIESERKNRTPLYLGMAAVLVIGGLLAVFLARRNPAPAPETAPTPVPVATEAVAAANVPPPAITAPAPSDPRAIQQEVQRELAAKRQAMKDQKAALAGAMPGVTPRRAPTSAPRVAPTEAPVARVVPAAPLPTAAAPEPTEVAVAPPPAQREAPAPQVAAAEVPTPAPREVPPAPARAAAPAEPEVARGDLVGPGPGVVEPSLLAPPRIAYPVMARQQKISGQVIVLVLVNENGAVTDARVQKGIGGRTGIDQVVLDAVRSSRFRAATKKGIPVKMWRTVVVDVRP
jgi:TonB family protein